MDTNKLLHFKMVHQTGNLREAAELLGISHAGLSKSIKSLENELGVELITKDGRGIKTTAIGLKILNNVEATLLSVKNLKNKAHDIITEDSTRCRIGTFEVFSTYLLPILAQSMPESVKLTMHELIPGKLEDKISKGEIDYGISYLPIPSKDLDHLKITKIKMGVYGLKNFNKLSFSQLPFVVPISSIEGTPTKAMGLDGWPENKFPRLIKYEVTLLESALALARQGLCVGYFPKFIIDLHNQMTKKAYQLEELQIPMKIKNEQDVYLVKTKNSKEDALARKIAKVIRGLN